MIEPASIEQELSAALASAAAAWPKLSVPPSVFRTFLEQRLRAAGGGLQPAQLHLAELYLICACLSGHDDALAIFEREYLSKAFRALARMKLGEREQDVKQRVRQLLFVARPGELPKISTYTGRGQLTAFLRVVAVREAVDVLEKERREVACDPERLDVIPVSDDDPELGYMKRTYRAAFQAAFASAFLSLPVRAKNLLRQQLIDGLTVTELGALYRVHHATAARWLVDARRELHERTRRELMARLGLSRSECESILRLAGSHLAQSISSLLRRA